MTRTELWERLWGNYIEKLRRIDELKAKGRYGYQLRMPYKSLDIAEKAVLKEFPEAKQYMNPPPRKSNPEMGLHTQEEQVQAVDLAADSLARGLDAAASNNLFGLSSEIGYLQSIADLAKSEGVESLANIAEANQFQLLQEFERLFGPMEGSSPTLGMHSKKERLDALDLAKDMYDLGVNADRHGDFVHIAMALGYLYAILEFAKQNHAKEVIWVVERQVQDLERRLQEQVGPLGRKIHF